HTLTRSVYGPSVSLHGPPRARVHARAADASGVGVRHRCRSAHGGRPRGPSAGQARAARRHPDGSRRRVWGPAGGPRARSAAAVRRRLRPTLATRIALLAVSVAILTSLAGILISVNLLQQASRSG